MPNDEARTPVTPQRPDGWYWIRSTDSRWRVGEFRDGIVHTPGSIFRPGADHHIGPRIPDPDQLERQEELRKEAEAQPCVLVPRDQLERNAEVLAAGKELVECCNMILDTRDTGVPRTLRRFTEALSTALDKAEAKC